MTALTGQLKWPVYHSSQTRSSWSLLHSQQRLSHNCTNMSSPWSTPCLQRSIIGWVESFCSWSSHLFRGQPGWRCHVRSGGQLCDMFTWSWSVKYPINDEIGRAAFRLSFKTYMYWTDLTNCPVCIAETFGQNYPEVRLDNICKKQC